MEKRLISAFVVLAIVVCMFPISAFAINPNVAPSGLGSNETWFRTADDHYYIVNKNIIVQQGDKWGYVACVQSLMNKFYGCTGNAAYYVGNIDSDFGPNTFNAVTTFQANMGLSVDGKVGPQTWATFHTRWLADLNGCKLPSVY